MPRLPPEIWEYIIDIIAGDFPEFCRPDLLSCHLTCRDWLPRSRFYLFSELRLRAEDQLDHVTKVLSSSPVLQNRVRFIEVISVPDAGVNQQSWVSLVPLRLAPHLPQLLSVQFCDIDLSKVHHSFYQFCTLFRTSRKHGPVELCLTAALWTQFSQVQRLVHAVGAPLVTLILPVDSGATPPPVNDFSRNHPRTSGPYCTSLRSLSIRGKGIEALNCIPWICLLNANPFLSNLSVVAYSSPTDAEWPEWVWLARNLGALYDRMCLSISAAVANGATPQTHSFSRRLSSDLRVSGVAASVTLQYQHTSNTSGPVHEYQELTLYADISSSRPRTSPSVALRRSLDLAFNVDATNVDHECFAIAGKLLGCVMDFADHANHDLFAMVDHRTLARLRGFQNMNLEIRPGEESDSSFDNDNKTFTPNFTIEPWNRSWGHIDDALTQPHFSTFLTRTTFRVYDMWARTILGGDGAEGWSCVVQLAGILLPRLAGRDQRVLCDMEAGKPCHIHERDLRKGEEEKGEGSKRRELA